MCMEDAELNCYPRPQSFQKPAHLLMRSSKEYEARKDEASEKELQEGNSQMEMRSRWTVSSLMRPSSLGSARYAEISEDTVTCHPNLHRAV